jgi:hypothetical protein
MKLSLKTSKQHKISYPSMNNSEGNYVFVRKVAIKSVNLPVNVLMVQNFWPVFEQTLGMGRAQAYDTIKMR